MLDRFKNVIRRLEVPQEREADVVYRILGDDHRVSEVSPTRYFAWRMRQDLTDSTVVASDSVQDVWIRTTFSIMPESQSYRPFGTSAVDTVLLEPLIEYSQRYDTWEQAEHGHRAVLDRVSRDLAAAEADREIARSFAGTAAEVRELLSEPMPDLFSVARRDEAARVRTPLRRADGSFIEVDVSRSERGFLLSEVTAEGRTDRITYSHEILEALSIAPRYGLLTGRVENPRQLGDALLRLGQAIAFHSRHSPA